jgi:hypothetical protein
MSRALAVSIGIGTLTLASIAHAEGKPPTAFAPAAQGGDILSTFGVHVYAGFAGGGDTIYEVTYTDGSTSSLDAGEGVMVGGGLTWTPFWFTDRLGLGFGYDVGYKLGTTGQAANGSINLERVPMVLSARGLLAIAGNYHLLLGVGGVAEFGVHLYGDGVATGIDGRFNDAFGGMAELGVLFGAPLALGAEITGRFTMLEYSAPGGTASAMSGSANFALHFFL